MNTRVSVNLTMYRGVLSLSYIHESAMMIKGYRLVTMYEIFKKMKLHCSK